MRELASLWEEKQIVGQTAEDFTANILAQHLTKTEQVVKAKQKSTGQTGIKPTAIHQTSNREPRGSNIYI